MMTRGNRGLVDSTHLRDVVVWFEGGTSCHMMISELPGKYGWRFSDEHGGGVTPQGVVRDGHL